MPDLFDAGFVIRYFDKKFIIIIIIVRVEGMATGNWDL